MRTTLDIEDDILRAAKDLAQRDGVAIGRVISDLARRGLIGPSTPKSTKQNKKRGFHSLPSRGEIITVDHVQNLMDTEGI